MTWLAIAGGVLVVGLLCWIAIERRRWRRSGRPDPWATPGSTFGSLDEVFHPTAHHAAEVRAVEHELPAPAPLPGDPPS